MIQLHKLRIFTAFAELARKQRFVESRGPTRKQNARARTLYGLALVCEELADKIPSDLTAYL